MARAGLVSVGTTPTQLSEGGDIVYLREVSGDIFLGDEAVTTAEGYPVRVGDPPQVVPLTARSPLYAIAATTETVRVLVI